MLAGDTEIEQLEALERAVQEIEALNLIYNDDDDDDDEGKNSSSKRRFTIRSSDEFKQAQEAVLNDYHGNKDKIGNLPLNLTVELALTLSDDDVDTTNGKESMLQFTLPAGYPSTTPALVSVIYVDTLNRKERDDLARELNQKALDFIGSEALMGMIQEFRDLALNLVLDKQQKEKDVTVADTDRTSTISFQFSRRWIWVHHITNNGRIKDIVQQANELSLGGYIKSGYPGVVVLEGRQTNCEEFVIWIKGNKSRPGGFGRNWGHHVRGQIDGIEDRKLPLNEFTHVGEELADFASLCQKSDVEEEFRSYVMQH